MKTVPTPRAASCLAAGTLVAALAAMAACGTALPDEPDPLADATRNGTGLDKQAGVAGAPGSVKELKFTVPKKAGAVDVVFLVDRGGVHRGGLDNIVRNRFNASMEGFTARVKFTRGDVVYRTGPSSVPSVNNEGDRINAPTMDKGYGFWRDSNEQSEGLKHDHPQFETEFRRRLFDAQEESYTYKPLASLSRVVGEAPATALRGKANKAFTSIVVINSRPDKADETSSAEVIETLDATLKGGWSLTVAGVPEKGCDLGDDKHTMLGLPTNAADGKDTNHRYRTFQLAKLAGARGRFVSLCSESFDMFFQDLAANPSGLEGGVVDLGARAVAKSIEVRSNKGLVTGWKYVPGETTLLLPGFLNPGLKLDIRFVVHDGKSANPLPGGLVAPQVVDKKLSPEEIEFVQKAAPLLQRNCNGCHSPGGNQKTYVGNYGNVRASKDAIKDRIARPDGDAQKMPQGRAMSAADVAALTQYLDSIK